MKVYSTAISSTTWASIEVLLSNLRPCEEIFLEGDWLRLNRNLVSKFLEKSEISRQPSYPPPLRPLKLLNFILFVHDQSTYLYLPKWSDFTWLVKCCFLLNFFVQKVHWKGFSPVCILWWTLRLALVLHLTEQSVHWNNVMPSSCIILLCFLKFLTPSDTTSQWGHLILLLLPWRV